MLSDLLQNSPKILAECAVAEPLRRRPDVTLHPTLFNTPLIYGPDKARHVMTSIYQAYIDTAANTSLPLLLTAPTWRLDPTRIAEADAPASINSDAVDYLIHIRDQHPYAASVGVGALTGPQNDCYRPDLAPKTTEAERFHSIQVDQLASTPADFLLAQTMPSVNEALGMAMAMAATDKPYLISFCTGTDGKVLDGTPLNDAMRKIDETVTRKPIGYFVNCTHPRFLIENYQIGDLDRLVGIQANASSKDVTQLDNSSTTETDPIATWTEAMLKLHITHNVPILGGCCGTSVNHMQQLAAS